MFIKEKKTIFIGVPRVASNSIKTILEPYIEDELRRDMLTAQQTFDRYNKITFRRNVKIAFVRNPWDRVASAFFGMPKELTKGMDFNEFIKEGVNNRSDKFHPFLVKQTDILRADEKIEIDYVGRYETLRRDFETACNLTGIKHVKLPRLNESKKFDYRYYYNSERKKNVAKFYEEEIDLFKYKFNNDRG
jgi:hypothetical protein